MKITPQSLLGLKRHFVGALSFPARTWLEPASSPRVVVTGAGTLRCKAGQCVVDLGSVASPGIERRTIRVSNLGPRRISATVAKAPEWLRTNWPGATGNSVELLPDQPGAPLELSIEHDAVQETLHCGVVTLWLRDPASRDWPFPIEVQMTARPAHAMGDYDFHGQTAPHEFDFGRLDPSGAGKRPAHYRLSIANRTSLPLMASFADLPAWLTFTVAGHGRSGPIDGRFFEHAAPLEIGIVPIAAPQFLGGQSGTIRLRTNDGRPEYRNIELRFRTRIEPAAPFVRVVRTSEPHAASEVVSAEALLENWGPAPARLSKQSGSDALTFAGPASIPPASGGAPGILRASFRIDPRKLPAGVHDLSMTLSVEGGKPPAVEVRLRITVTAATRPPAGLRRIRIETIAAVISVLFAIITWIVLSL